jgi:uncharacterized DUF497 family protein
MDWDVSVPPVTLDNYLLGVQYLVAITFTPAKRTKTLKERGLDFADADDVFAGRHTVFPDDRRDYGEARYISAGWLRRRMVVIVWTPRGRDRHVISMRYCHAKEESHWREILGEEGLD